MAKKIWFHWFHGVRGRWLCEWWIFGFTTNPPYLSASLSPPKYHELYSTLFLLFLPLFFHFSLLSNPTSVLPSFFLSFLPWNHWLCLYSDGCYAFAFVLSSELEIAALFRLFYVLILLCCSFLCLRQTEVFSLCCFMIGSYLFQGSCLLKRVMILRAQFQEIQNSHQNHPRWNIIHCPCVFFSKASYTVHCLFLSIVLYLCGLLAIIDYCCPFLWKFLECY